MTSWTTGLLDMIPGWGVLVVTLLATFLSTEVGFRLGTIRRSRVHAKEKERMRPGPFTAAVLGLLGFMLAIIYGGVEAQTRSLKQGALDEVNAIGAVYRRADLMPDAQRAEIRRILRQYVDHRLAMGEGGSAEHVEESWARLQELQGALWSQAVVLAKDESATMASQFVSSVSRMFEVTNKKLLTAVHYRVPGTLWIVLFGLAILGMGLGGYTSGISGSRRLNVISLVSAAAYSVVFMLVVTQDRPLHAAQVTRTAMVSLSEWHESVDEHRALSRQP